MTTATTVNVQFQLRADTAANWTAENPILLANEFALETDTKKLKVGDGTTAWASLAYFPSIVTGGTVLGNLEIGSTGTLTFEGSTADGYETQLAVTDPTADRTITLPDQSGTVVVSGNASIVDADIADSAEIAVSKLANGTANQVLVTDGTDVSWSDDLTLAGDLTVNGTTTTINTETLVVEDKNIELGVVDTPTDLTADGGGITLKGTTDKTINWIDSTDAWTSSERFSVPLGSAASPSLTFTGDENTGIYSPGADQVAVATNGTGRLFVDASGNLTHDGTQAAFKNGTGVPNFALFGRNTDGRAELTFRDNTGASNNARFVGTSTFLSMETGGTERLRITDAGLVGIGTSSPSSLLHVNSASAGMIRTNRTTDERNHIALGTQNTIRGYIGATSSNCFEISDDGGTSKVTVTNGGNVGIGTTSPGAALDVRARDLHLGATSGGAGLITFRRDSGLQSGYFGWDAGSDFVMRWGNDSGSGRLAFNTNSNERVRIDENGRVGIGTTSPGAPLDVIAARGNLVRFQESGSPFNGLVFSTDSTGATIKSNASSGYLAFNTGNSESARIDSSGRLLVGVAFDTGGALLQVNGDRIRVATAKTPASATATGTAGEICWDADYIYVCTATNTWKRTAISTW